MNETCVEDHSKSNYDILTICVIHKSINRDFLSARIHKFIGISSICL